jgi:hypothetical protein
VHPEPERAAGFFVARRIRRLINAQLAVELEAFAERIRRIRAVGRNGDLEPFHIDRSQARHDCLKLAEWARTGRRPADYTLAADRLREDEARARYSNGRGSGVR